MLVKRLEKIVENFNVPEEPIELYHFNYGKDHWQNLGDYPNDEEMPFTERNKYLLLLWQDREFKLNEYGATVGFIYTGELILSVRSKISDADYNYKYDTHIRKLQKESEMILKSFDICEEWTITRWKEIEVENLYDTNMDGLKIQFTLIYDENY